MPIQFGLPLVWTHLLPVSGLIALGAAAARLLSSARRILRHVPPAVLKLLSSERERKELLAIITDLASYANLTKEERRKLALQLVARWLARHGIPLSDHEIATLVELLYSWVHHHTPQRIAPAPVELGGR